MIELRRLRKQKNVAQSTRAWQLSPLGRGNSEAIASLSLFAVVWNWALSNIETGHMRSKIGALPLLLVGFLLASCASPRGLDEPPLQIPPLKPGYGRVYFTRPGEFAGSAIQPEIRMTMKSSAGLCPAGSLCRPTTGEIRGHNGNRGRKCGYVPIGRGRDEVHQDGRDTRHTRRPCHADARILRAGTIRHKPPQIRRSRILIPCAGSAALL